MKFDIDNGSADKQSLVLAAANFYAQELGVRHLKFEVKMGFMSKELADRMSCHGFTTPNKKHTEVVMGLSNVLSPSRLLLVLAHEMVHVSQIAQGQLAVREIDGWPATYWKGIEVDCEYRNQPWEIEANAREEILFKKLMKVLES